MSSPAGAAPGRLLAFRRRRLLVRGSPASIAWLPAIDVEWAGMLQCGVDLATATRVVDLTEDAAIPDGTQLRELRELLSVLDPAEAPTALRALHVLEWARTHRFCGRCGAPNEETAAELARRCPRCALTSYPRISPAVIVLVRRGDRVLLGRGVHRPEGLFSTLAGFVEPGESLEEAVRREIREEAGVDVTDVRYFGSQPWPFPDSLMIGFTAEHAGGEVRVDETELAEARWFALDELPLVPPPFSIARTLVDAWVRERGGDPRALRTWPA